MLKASKREYFPVKKDNLIIITISNIKLYVRNCNDDLELAIAMTEGLLHDAGSFISGRYKKALE
jgi:hypothetical protein